MKKLLLFICLLLVSVKSLNAQSVYLPEGSVIIDMGVEPQTIENGLKPYGLVYSLITNYSTPVIWSINQSKSKDGVDFIVDNREFRGGTFVINAQFLTDDVINEISVWESQGVVIYESLSASIIPLYRELKFFPNWVLDTNNGGIAVGYLENAGIPVELASREALPTELTTCDDLFILPHADPTWEDHGEALLNWNSPLGSGPDTANGGYIWSGCHAVSALENLYNPNDPSEQTNFLSLKIEDAIDNGNDYYENALSLWGEHNGASEITPYQIDFPTDPFMQFVGSTDGAHAGGSEQIYLPVLNGGWRTSTQISVWDANHEDLGLLSNGKAALIAYGYAFGDTNRGQVMYEAGHELSNGTDEENIAAQRAFLNFSFEAAKAKVPSLVVNSSVPEIIEGGDIINFDVFANTNNGTDITYQWSTTNSTGTFNDSTSATPIFSTSLVELPERCVVTVKVSDGCGRITFNSWGFEIVPQPTAPVANEDSYATYNTSSVSFNALANDTDLNNNIDSSTFEVLSPFSVAGGNFVNNGNGNITFNPDPNFSGIATLDYQICDDTPIDDGGPFCETATVTIHVAESSCDSSETISNETSYALEVMSSNKWKNEDDALDFPDSKYSKSDDSEEGFVIYDLGDIAYVGSYITIRYTTDKGEHVNGVIDVSSSASGFPNEPNTVSSILEDPNYEFLFIPVQEIGLRYVKISGDTGFAIESIQFEKEICIEPSLELIAPTVNNFATE
ncbi:MAG: cadherin-like domain-containing protein, partial [Winogradskyella sp.]|nr:cadherin-like domain-containing protein [Winogradskyella sp.]